MDISQVESLRSEALPFDPAIHTVMLARSQLEVTAALGAAELAGFEVQAIFDPKTASETYRDHVMKYNDYCASIGKPFGYGVKTCTERALEVVAAGGAALVLAGREMNGLEKFGQIYRREMAAAE